MTQDRLIAELMEKASKAPGCVPGFLHPIEGRILMLNTGVRAQVGLKIFGDDLGALQKRAIEAENILRGVRGAAGVASTRVNTKSYLNIDLDREALARWVFKRARCSMSLKPGSAAKRFRRSLKAGGAFRFRSDIEPTIGTISAGSAT